MDGGVAQSAGLVLLRLIVETWSGRRVRPSWICREGMALKTQEIHLCALQEAGVGRAVRCVARYASFRLYRLMLVDERTGFV